MALTSCTLSTNTLGGSISREQKKWLENRLHDDRPEVADTARMVYNACFPFAGRNERKHQLVINALEFEVNTEVPDGFGDVEKAHQIFTADRHTRVLTFRDLDSDGPKQSIVLDGGRMAKLLRWAVHSLEILCGVRITARILPHMTTIPTNPIGTMRGRMMWILRK